MSSLEQEPQLVTGVAVAAAETNFAAVATPGTGVNQPLSSVSAPAGTSPQSPFRMVRVRGVAWVTGTASFLTIRLRQGAGTAGVQVGPAFTNTISATGAAPLASVGVPFEFIDTAPAGTVYTLTATGSAATTASAAYNVTGLDG